jgi:hypothetical protein
VSSEPLGNPIRQGLFMTVKYLVYGVLTWNGIQFYLGEVAVHQVTFSEGLSLMEVVEVYSATIDSFFWLFLVAMLELETYVIEDDVLKRPWVKFSLMFLRSLSYAMIIYALYGYWVKLGFQADIVPLAIKDACDLVDQNFSILIILEEYVPLTAESCQTLAGQDLYRINGENIVAPLGDLIYARNVASIDVINASTWLGIIVILEVDVWYQLKGGFKGVLLKVSNILKIGLYTTLFACALAWGVTGVFLDIVDAVLWLFAFFFIELNLFQWQQETEEEAA